MAVDAPEELDWQVRAFVYRFIVEETRPPTAAETAAALNIAEERAHEAYRRLDARHAVILEPGAETIRMAHPFSAVPTLYRVRAAGRAYWANCAWDVFGIAVALKSDVRAEARFPDGSAPALIGVEGDNVVGHGEIIHFPLPFAHWYDDLITTCAAMLLFRTEADVDAWCSAQQSPRGEILTLEQIWALSKPWYGTRMNPDYHGRSVAEAQAVFAQVGLTSDFWQASPQE